MAVKKTTTEKGGLPTFQQTLTDAGYDLEELATAPDRIEELRVLRESAGRDLPTALVLLLRENRELTWARRQCDSAAEAAQRLEKLLAGLLDGPAALCRGVGPIRPGSPPTMLCELNGRLLELAIHPGADLDELAALEPWHLVRVHERERVIIGLMRDEVLFGRALGEVAEFKDWFDQERGQAVIVAKGQDEEVVTVTDSLLNSEAGAGDRFVLMRSDPSQAIARLSGQSAQSRFEVPIDTLDTSLDDVAGFDSIIDPFLEDVVLRIVYADVRDRFALEPLHGALLFSYKPGMGKTMFARALACWLDELGEEHDFEVVLYVVKPNELKIVWHGGDAKLVREDLCGAIRARQAAPRSRTLLQLVVMDEVDSLGRRAGGDGVALLSGAQNDAVQALLAEIDGLAQAPQSVDMPPAHVVWLGLTNRPDALDDALKRPGRFGDLVIEIPDATPDGAEAVMAVYARGANLPFVVDDEVREDLDEAAIRTRLLRPAIAQVFGATVLRYSTERARRVAVSAGQVLANVHYKHALNAAKRSAARRQLYDDGVPAITFEDIADGLVEQAFAAASQLEADRQTLGRQLRLGVRITAVEVVPRDELQDHRFVRQ